MMNLQPLFEAQKKLDEHIEKSKGLEGQNLLDKKILALQVELGELANEWRGFKYWSEDQKPNTKMVDMVNTRPGSVKYKYPLLEEYVDCLHFILSIGNDIGYNTITEERISERGYYSEEFTGNAFIMLMSYSSDLYIFGSDKSVESSVYEFLFLSFIALGLNEEHLGFTWEQIEQAYFAKNEENHRRQENGY